LLSLKIASKNMVHEHKKNSYSGGWIYYNEWNKTYIEQNIYKTALFSNAFVKFFIFLKIHCVFIYKLQHLNWLKSSII